MKRLIALTLALCAVNASAKLGSTKDIKYAGDLAYKTFCEAVVKDDVAMLKRSIRSKVGVVAGSDDAVLELLTAVDGMACNGVDLMAFSKQRRATQVAKYLSNKK